MIVIKNKRALSRMEKAGQLLSEIFENLKSFIEPGMTTLEIDAWIESCLLERHLVPRTKGYHGYKHASCISVNDVLIHGVPSDSIVLKSGDLVKIDVVASWKGYCADMARSFFIGEVSTEIKRFVNAAQSALDAGIAMVRAGNRLTDISAAIQQKIEAQGFGVVRDFAGHGIGKDMHEEPEILNYGKPGQGPVLVPGMVLAIEPMITMGRYEVEVGNDGWTVRTKDRSLATHVEDTVVVTKEEPKILTRSMSFIGGSKL